MKNLFFTFLICLSGSAVFGQFNIGAGAQMIFDNTILGVQGKALYEWNDTWRAAGTFTLHLKSGIDWTLDMDAQYKLLQISDNFDFAPLAGISVTSFTDGGEIEIHFGREVDFFVT